MKRKPVDDRNTESPLAIYFRDVAQLGVMSAEEERAAAQEIAALRQACWATIFSCRSLVAPVAALLEARCEEAQALKPELERVKSAALRPPKRGFQAAAKALAVRMAYVDVDGTVLALVRADLDALRAGRRDGLRMAGLSGKCCSGAGAQCILSAMAELDRAKERFVKANLRLVLSVARRHRHTSLSFHDLVQEGNLGLMKAVGRFDHRRGFRFSTYATWWIRHAIGRAIADKDREIRLPVHLRDRLFAINRARRAFERAHGCAPSDSDLCAALGISVEQLASTRMAASTSIPLDHPLGEDGATVGDLLEDKPDLSMNDEIDYARLRAYIPELLEKLTPIEADIIRSRFGLNGDELPFRVLGERHSLCRERIRQLQEQALDKLGRELRRRGLLADLKLMLTGGPS